MKRKEYNKQKVEEYNIMFGKKGCEGDGEGEGEGEGPLSSA